LAIFALAIVAHGALARPAAAQGDSWSPLAPLPTPRRLLAAAAEGGAIYTFGGCGSPCFDPPLHTSTFEETLLEVYEGGSWSVRKTIPAILFGAAAAAPGNGRIYLFGGFVTGNSAYEYDPHLDAWSRKAAMPTPRHGLAAVALDGKVYVLGGSNGSAAMDALEVYDPALNSWHRKAPMPTPRVFLAAAAVNGRIYAIGGSPDCCGNGTTNVVEVYDPATDQWSSAKPLPVALQVSAAAEVNGRIYVFGGFIPGLGVQGSTFEYDPAAEAWTSRAPMREARDQAPAVVLEGVAHVLGGSVDCHCHARDTHDGYTPPPPPQSPPTADLEIKKTSVPAGPVSPGQALQYSITVTNLGPAAVSGATVTDDLKSTGLEDVKWCRGAGCAPSIAGNLLDTVALAAKESVTYEAMGIVAPHATGTVSNTAEVHPPVSPEDRNLENNHSTITNRIAPCSVSITKTADRSSAAPGDDLRYEITVHNACPVAVQATVTDDLAATGLAGTRWCRGAGCTPSIPGDLADAAALPANGSVTYEVAGTVPCACGQTRIDNTACVTVTGQPAVCDQPNPVPIVPAPGGDLALAIAGPGNLTSCGTLPYTFTVTNRGPGVACGAVLQAQPPAGSALVSVSSPCAGLPCGLGNLAPGSQVQVTATFSVPAGLQCPTSLPTTASVSACGSDTKSFETKVPCDLAITKSDGLDTAAPGDPILYTIGIKNQGCAAVSGAGVADVFPAELNAARWCRGAACAPSNPGNLTDTLDLPAGGMETYRAAGTISPTFTGTLRNTASVTPPGSATVSATDETQIVPAPGVTAMCIIPSGSPFRGSPNTKVFVISNGGPKAQGDNPGPEFVDSLPAGLTLVGATASSGTVTIVGNTVSWDGSIPVGGSVTVEITVTLDNVPFGTTICNSGTVFFDVDGDGVNESSRSTPVPCCITVEPPMIPGLSGSGLAVLALLLAALALTRLRRSRHGI
jgi:uncharacterized repeat protein (TIGR01451 family)